MTESGPTENQMKLVNRLREESQEREGIFQKFLRDSGKTTVDELSVQETSNLIDELKKIRVESDRNNSDLLAMGKQIDFLTRLQDTEDRRIAARDFLRKHGYDAINYLKMNEASELIDMLMKMPRGENNSPDTASKKQLQFIKNLQSTDKQLDITKKFLSDLKKTGIEELTRKEASSLIDKLKV